jgi:hypothetical protein
MTTKRSLALVVEGVGDDATSSGGIAWMFGKTVDTPGIYEVLGGRGVAEGLAQRPDSVAATVNPFDCSAQGSAYTFRIHGSSRAKRLFLSRPLEPADSLSAEIDSDATTVALSAANYTWSSSDDGSVVFIGDEAIRLGTYAAGPQFTGCTRGYYSTIAGVQPNGMNVWRKNPFVKNRRAILVLYDHDAATWTQVWQGFVDAPVLNSSAVEISARDLLSVLGQGNINRGKTKHLKWPGPPAARQKFTDRPFRLQPASPGYSGKRINKPLSTSPHWTAIRVGGALYYMQFDSTTGLLTAGDTATTYAGSPSSESLPQLQSDFGEPKGKDRVAREVLVVDRHRDHAASQTNPAYADFRSSTRELEYPFHPVAISMALLTSGYSRTPGEAGTGAAGADTTPTAFGTTVTLAQAATQYFTVAGSNDIYDIKALGLTDQCLIMQRYSSAGDPGLKLIPADGGAAVWTTVGTGMVASPTFAGGVDHDGTYVYYSCEEDGTYAANGRPIARKLAIADGSTISWTASNTTGSAIMCTRGVAYDATNDDVYWQLNHGSNEIKRTVGSSGTNSGTGNDSAVLTLVAMCMAGDDSHVMGFGAVTATTAAVSGWATPVTGTATAATWTLDLDATSSFGAQGTASATTNIPRLRSDTVDGAWLTYGYSTLTDHPYIYHITSAGTLDLEIDVGADSGYTPGSRNGIRDIAVDKFGDVYCLLNNASSGGSVDIVRYQSDGTLVYSAITEGVSSLPDNSALSIAVDDSGNIYIGDADGYVYVFEQA